MEIHTHIERERDVYIYMDICIYIYIHIHTYIHVYIHAYTHSVFFYGLVSVCMAVASDTTNRSYTGRRVNICQPLLDVAVSQSIWHHPYEPRCILATTIYRYFESLPEEAMISMEPYEKSHSKYQTMFDPGIAAGLIQ